MPPSTFQRLGGRGVGCRKGTGFIDPTDRGLAALVGRQLKPSCDVITLTGSVICLSSVMGKQKPSVPRSSRNMSSRPLALGGDFRHPGSYGTGTTEFKILACEEGTWSRAMNLRQERDKSLGQL